MVDLHSCLQVSYGLWEFYLDHFFIFVQLRITNHSLVSYCLFECFHGNWTENSSSSCVVEAVVCLQHHIQPMIGFCTIADCDCRWKLGWIEMLAAIENHHKRAQEGVHLSTSPESSRKSGEDLLCCNCFLSSLSLIHIWLWMRILRYQSL